jgi:hypothetical protein
MKRLLSSLCFFLSCSFFALIAMFFSKDFEVIGMLTGFCFGVMVNNTLDMSLRANQALLVKEIENGYKAPQD